MIDTHCHIYLDDFKPDIKEVLDRAGEAGVGKILMPAIDFHSLKAMEQLNHPDISFYKMAGVHPCEIKEKRIKLARRLAEWASRDDIIGIGETGLDYYWSTDYIEEQKQSLRIHCDVAKDTDKPIILHNREASADLFRIIEEAQDGRLRGIWHCFNGSVEEGKRAIDLGLILGIGGVTTFKNAGVDKSVSQLPVESMVLETDAPYLAPAPKRGKRNEPAFMKYTASKLALIKDLDPVEVDRITTENALRFFRIDNIRST